VQQRFVGVVFFAQTARRFQWCHKISF